MGPIVTEDMVEAHAVVAVLLRKLTVVKIRIARNPLHIQSLWDEKAELETELSSLDAWLRARGQ